MWLSSDASRVRRRAAPRSTHHSSMCNGSGMARSQSLKTMSRRLPGPRLGRERSVLVIPYRPSTQGASAGCAGASTAPGRIPLLARK
jgi:hypothetical protein